MTTIERNNLFLIDLSIEKIEIFIIGVFFVAFSIATFFLPVLFLLQAIPGFQLSDFFWQVSWQASGIVMFLCCLPYFFRFPFFFLFLLF